MYDSASQTCASLPGFEIASLPQASAEELNVSNTSSEGGRRSSSSSPSPSRALLGASFSKHLFLSQPVPLKSVDPDLLTDEVYTLR